MTAPLTVVIQLGPMGSPMTAPTVTRLPAFRPYLDREYVGTGSATGWVSSWQVNEDEPLGGERAVYWWLRVVWKRTAVDAVRLTRLYWKIRDIGYVPANLERDVEPHRWMFRALENASWCVVCRAMPQSSGNICLWCHEAGL